MTMANFQSSTLITVTLLCLHLHAMALQSWPENMTTSGNFKSLEIFQSEHSDRRRDHVHSENSKHRLTLVKRNVVNQTLVNNETSLVNEIREDESSGQKQPVVDIKNTSDVLITVKYRRNLRNKTTNNKSVISPENVARTNQVGQFYTQFVGSSSNISNKLIALKIISDLKNEATRNRAGTSSQEVSSPTQEVSNPTQEVSNPTQEASIATQEVSSPTQEVSSPTQEVSSPTQEFSSTTQEDSSPTQEVSSPTEGDYIHNQVNTTTTLKCLGCPNHHVKKNLHENRLDDTPERKKFVRHSLNRTHTHLRHGQQRHGSMSRLSVLGVKKLINNTAAAKEYGLCVCQNTACDCSNCHLTSVPQDLSKDITELILSINYIEVLKSNTLLRYRFLKTLDLSLNQMSTLMDGSFTGLAHLVVLDLSNNEIGNSMQIAENIFEPLISLKILRMNFNKFPCKISRVFPDVYLAYLYNLEELYLDNYGNNDYGSGFRNMTSLRNLSFTCSECPFHFLTNETFRNVGQITSLNISNCSIRGSHIETGSFLHFKNLQTLDISQNLELGVRYLPLVMWGLRNSTLQTLRINNIVNKYLPTYIENYMVQHLPQTMSTLVARGNNIISIEAEAVRSLPKSLKAIDISENNFLMNPEKIPMHEMEGLENLMMNSHSEECFSEDEVNGVMALWNTFNSQEGHDVEKHKSGNRLTGNQSVSRIVIPGKLKRVQINLKYMHEDFIFHIDKQNNLEVLDLSCSYLSKFNFGSLEQLRKLTFLNIRRSSIRELVPPWKIMGSLKFLILRSNFLNDFLSYEGAPFVGLIGLAYLDLSLNQLERLRSDLFEGLDNLEYLRLDRNVFSHFEADISSMTHLKLLNVSNTELSHLPTHICSHIDQLCQISHVQIRVDMSGCPIQCDCFNLDFLKWMVGSEAFDKNFTGYKCQYQDTSFMYILDGYQETIRDLDRECAKNYPVFLVILAATLILLCLVMGVIFYRFRWKIRYLYYGAYLKFTDKHKKTSSHAYNYDLFISYDSEDQGFVTRCLCPELEKRGLKLLIHTRDFVAGTYIASNIVMAVAESRKTLVILTRNLLESSWCNYEIQMATMEAVHTGRQVLVFLLKDAIPNRELDVELLRHIKSNTYLPYPSPEDEGDEVIMKRFYNKLAHDLKC